jgi:hypothetical protein
MPGMKLQLNRALNSSSGSKNYNLIMRSREDSNKGFRVVAKHLEFMLSDPELVIDGVLDFLP